MREARTNSFDKVKAPITEWRPCKNQKARILKNGKPGFLSCKFLTPTGC
jgi:hypothetical protein